jgi:hypothetical protein
MVSHADKENGGAAASLEGAKLPVQLTIYDGGSAFGAVTVVGYAKLTNEQKIKFLGVLHGKEGGDAQVIALGKELKARYKYGKKTLDLFKKAMKAGEAKKVEALKEIQGARESGDEAYNELKALKEALEAYDEGVAVYNDGVKMYNEFKTIKEALAILESAISLKAEADRHGQESAEQLVAKWEADQREHIAFLNSLDEIPARAQEKLAASQAETAEQKRLKQNVIAADLAARLYQGVVDFKAEIEAARSAALSAAGRSPWDAGPAASSVYIF